MADSTFSNFGIQDVELELELKGELTAIASADFVIDGQLLSRLLGVDRNSLGMCATDLALRGPAEGLFRRYVDQLVGDVAPVNQFGTERLVLYRCHCGCDYCGVVSCMIDVGDSVVEWHDIRFEWDGDDDPLTLQRVDLLRFRRGQYLDAIDQYATLLGTEVSGVDAT